MFLKVTDSCLQFWGGMGFTEDVIEIHDMMTFLEKSFKYYDIAGKIIWIFQVRVSRLYRDLRLWSIGGGADEVKSFPDVFRILFHFILFSFHFLQMFFVFYFHFSLDVFVFLIWNECFSNVTNDTVLPYCIQQSTVNNSF